jgi:hypothetical protein
LVNSFQTQTKLEYNLFGSQTVFIQLHDQLKTLNLIIIILMNVIIYKIKNVLCIPKVTPKEGRNQYTTKVPKCVLNMYNRKMIHVLTRPIQFKFFEMILVGIA